MERCEPTYSRQVGEAKATTATTLATNEAHDRQVELKLAGKCEYEILQCQLRNILNMRENK